MIDRAFRMLDAFDGRHRRLTITELARRADLPLSSAHRLAERLADWGAIERESDGRYVVGLRLYEVASLAPRGLGFRDIAAPFLEDLFIITRQHVQLAVLDGATAVLVDRRSGPGAVEVDYRVGGKLPLLTTALGRVLLAHLSTADLHHVLANCTDPEDLERRDDVAAITTTLKQVKADGIARVLRQRPAPLTALAAPIRASSGKVSGALSLVVPAAAPTESLEPALRTAARGIARAVGRA